MLQDCASVLNVFCFLNYSCNIHERISYVMGKNAFQGNHIGVKAGSIQYS